MKVRIGAAFSLKKPAEWLGGALIDYDYSIFLCMKCANSVKILKVWLKDALNVYTISISCTKATN
jgi:hypothetical protein